MGWLAFSRFGGIFLFQVGSILIPSWRVKLLLFFRLVVHDSQGSLFDVNGLSWCCMDWCIGVLYLFVCFCSAVLCCRACLLVRQAMLVVEAYVVLVGGGEGGALLCFWMIRCLNLSRYFDWRVCGVLCCACLLFSQAMLIMEAYVVIGGTVFLQEHGPLVCVCLCRVVGQVGLYGVYGLYGLYGLYVLYGLYDF